MTRLLPGVFGSSGEDESYQIPYSVSTDNGGFSKPVISGGSRQKFTISLWYKPSVAAASEYIFTTTDVSGNTDAYFYISGGTLTWWDKSNGTDGIVTRSFALYEDTSSWYHFVLSADYANASQTNRVRMYVNGNRINSLQTANYPSTSDLSYVNAPGKIHYFSAPGNRVSGYLAEAYFVDNLALTPSDFGETVNNFWVPKEYTGSLGTNGVHLGFKEVNSIESLGKDSSRSDDYAYYNMSVVGTVQHSNTQSKYGGTSLYFDGNISRLTSNDHPLAGIGTRDFTIEGWFRPTSWALDTLPPGYYRRLWTYGTDVGNYLGLNLLDNGVINIRSGSDTLKASSSSVLPLNSWTHLALTRCDNTFRLFMNGVQVASFTETINYDSYFSSTFMLGGLVGQNSGSYQGWIDDFRITKGLARYTANFTPAECPVGDSDPYWNNVRMLIKADGANGSTTVPVLSGSSWNVNGSINTTKELRTAGGVSQLNTSQAKFGSSSLYYDDSGGGDAAKFVNGTSAGNSTIFGSDFTIESWFRPVSGGDRSIYVLSNGSTYLAFNVSITNNQFNIYLNSVGPSASPSYSWTTNTWYHVALSRSGTSTNNLKLFVNGQIVWQTTNNSVLGYSDPTIHRLGGGVSGAQHWIDDFRVYNGVGKYTTTFTPPTSALPVGESDPYWKNVLIALPCEIQTGMNNKSYYYGFWLNDKNKVFTDTPSYYGTDTGNGGEVRGNYCTVHPWSIFGSATLSNGALSLVGGNDCMATLGVNSGKWYWETTLTSLGTSGNVPHWGIMVGQYSSGENSLVSVGSVVDLAWRRNDEAGGAYSNYGYMTNISGGYVAGTSVSVGQTVSHILDLESTPKTYQMKVGQRTIYSITFSYNNKKSIVPYLRMNPGVTNILNTGQAPFFGTPPSGHKALCSTNLPDPEIANPSLYVAAKPYTGNGGTNNISSYNFSPDLVYFKERSNGFHGGFYDSVRGPLKVLSPSRIDIAETNDSTGLTSFNSNGFTLNGDGFFYSNRSGQIYASIGWDAGDGSPVVNNDGTIPTLVKANQEAGFSIYTYNGQNTAGTLGHGLGQKCDFTIIKRRNSADNRRFWTYFLENNAYRVNFDTNTSFFASDGNNGVQHTNNLVNTITISDNDLNISGGTYVAWSWAEIPGFSSFGYFPGNASINGPFVYTGFKPAVILIKQISTVASDWNLFDNARQGIGNRFHNVLYPSNVNLVEQAYQAISLHADGFKIVSTNTGAGDFNASKPMLYMAWAESPFKYSRGA